MNEYVNELVKLPDRRMVMLFDPEYLVVFDHMENQGGKPGCVDGWCCTQCVNG